MLVRSGCTSCYSFFKCRDVPDFSLSPSPGQGRNWAISANPAPAKFLVGFGSEHIGYLKLKVMKVVLACERRASTKVICARIFEQHMGVKLAMPLPSVQLVFHGLCGFAAVTFQKLNTFSY